LYAPRLNIIGKNLKKFRVPRTSFLILELDRKHCMTKNTNEKVTVLQTVRRSVRGIIGTIEWSMVRKIGTIGLPFRWRERAVRRWQENNFVFGWAQKIVLGHKRFSTYGSTRIPMENSSINNVKFCLTEGSTRMFWYYQFRERFDLPLRPLFIFYTCYTNFLKLPYTCGIYYVQYSFTIPRVLKSHNNVRHNDLL
jgi:hypothetical protein